MASAGGKKKRGRRENTHNTQTLLCFTVPPSTCMSCVFNLCEHGQTDATNMADSSAVADATKVVDEGTSKKIPGERSCTNRQKALAAEIDVTHMAEPTLVPDATKVVDQGTTKRIPTKTKSRNSQQGNPVAARSKKKSQHVWS